MKRRTILKQGTALALAAMPRVAAAQAWPSQPIHVVVPGPAGNALDALARLMCAAMAQSMKAVFVVDNKPGASGHIGGEFVAAPSRTATR